MKKNKMYPVRTENCTRDKKKVICAPQAIFFFSETFMSMSLKLDARTRCKVLCTTILLNFTGAKKKKKSFYFLLSLPPNPKPQNFFYDLEIEQIVVHSTLHLVRAQRT